MKRRHILALAGAAAATPARSQNLPVVGVLVAGDAEPNWSMLRKSMADLGYVDGRNLIYQFRSATPASGQLAVHAADLVKADVNLIIAILTPAILAAKAATTRIPIVFNGGVADTGLVTNLARPEGNLTGIHGAGSLLAAKCVQIFHELKPTARSVAVLLNAPDPFHVPLQRAVGDAARAQKLEFVPVMIKGHSEIAPAFDELARRGVDAVIVQPTLPLQHCAELAIKHRLPALSFRREFAQVGGLMSYGADQAAIYRVLASYVDKILKGASTSSLPIEIATYFELVLNQKTARTLGLPLSPMFLGRVDEVIE